LLWRLGLGCALVTTVSVRARAEDLSDLQGLLSEQVVTSASKQSEGVTAAPALSMSFSAEDLRRYGVTTVAEAIDYLSIGLASSDNLDGGEMGARGVLISADRGSHFLLLVDGHAMNEPLRGSTWFGRGAGIPIELIDHIEVIVGPGSVLYGSNAMLGLINVVTKGADTYGPGKVIVESTLPLSLRAAAGIGQKFELFGAKGEVVSQLEYFEQTGPDFYFEAEDTGPDPFTGQPGRYSRALKGTGIWGGARADRAMFQRAPAGNLRVSLGNTELHLRASMFEHATPTGPGNFNDPESVDVERRVAIDLKHNRTVSTLLSLSGRLYADYFQTQSDFITSLGAFCPLGAITCDYQSHGSASWGGLELQSDWDWLHDRGFVTTVGVDARLRDIQATNNVVDADTGAVRWRGAVELDETDATVGTYLQQSWAVSSWLKLNGGARIDFDQRFPVVLTPRAVANVHPWKHGTIKLGYAEAFRAPSWDETDNAAPRRIVAEDGLDPEKVRSVEITLQQQVGTHRATVGAFYSTWTDIVRLQALSRADTVRAIRAGQTTVPYAPSVALTQFQNLYGLDNYGVNLGIDGTFANERLLYGFALTGASAEQTDADGRQRLSVAPRLFGNARLAYVLGDPLPTVALATHWLGPRLANAGKDSGFVPVPYAPAQLELRLTLTGNVPAVPALKYRAFVNYVTADRGPYLVGPALSALPTQTTPQLNPVDRLRSTVAVEYDF
jgi:outer membrane receptor protein involved in Fe transport